MKYTLIVFLLLFQTACITYSGLRTLDDCPSQRFPSSTSCERVFLGSLEKLHTPSDLNIEKAFRQIAEQWQDQNKNNIRVSYMNPIGGRGGALVQGLYLVKQFNLGSSYVKTLVDLYGFKIITVTEADINPTNKDYLKVGDQIMIPGMQLIDYYKQINQEIEQLILSKQIKASEALWPSFIFTRLDYQGRLDFLSIRPGIDPLPDKTEGWTIDDHNTELSQKQYAKITAAGHRPLPAHQFYHDLGHFIDLLKSPRTMAGWRRFNQLKYEAIVKHEALNLPYSEGRFDPIGAIEYYVNEFLFLPDKAEWVKIFGQGLLSRKLTRLEVTEFFKNKSTGEITALAQKIIQGFESEKLIQRYGGAAHDGAFFRMLNEARFYHALIARVGVNDLPRIDVNSYSKDSLVLENFPFLTEDYFGLTRAMSIALNLNGSPTSYVLKNLVSRQSVFDDAKRLYPGNTSLVNLSEAQQKKVLDLAIRNLVVEFYYRSWWSLHLEIIPEVMIDDLTTYLQTMDNKSARSRTKSYQFFDAVAQSRNSLFRGMFGL